MSRDPSLCSECPNREIYVEHSQSRGAHLTADFKVNANPSVSLSTPVNIVRNPNEVEDEGRCANPTCRKGQAEIRKSLEKINDGLERAARTGNWTGVNKREVERFEQLGEGALDHVDEYGVEWPDDKTKKDWNDIEDEIDEFDENFTAAAEYARFLHSQRGSPNPGLKKLPTTTSASENLTELRDNINNSEQVPDEEPSIPETEREDNEQQERNETAQNPDGDSIEAQQERIKELEAENEELTGTLANRNKTIEELETENEELTGKLADRNETIDDLEVKNNELTDDKRDLVDEKMGLVNKIQKQNEDILDLKEELQNARAKIQQLETERENETATDTTPENVGDGQESASPGATGGGGAAAGESESNPSEPATEANEQDDTESLSKGQRWVMNPDAPTPDTIPEQYEDLVGKPLPESLRNGGTENAGPERENERDGSNDTDHEPDDDTPGGGPTF